MKQIKELRKTKRIPLTAYAAAGVSRQTVISAANGKSATVATLEKIAKLYDKKLIIRFE